MMNMSACVPWQGCVYPVTTGGQRETCTNMCNTRINFFFKKVLNDTLLLPIFNSIHVKWHTTQRWHLTINSASISHRVFNNFTRPPQFAINCKLL